MIKIALVGDMMTGKSSFIKFIRTGKLVTRYKVTVGPRMSPLRIWNYKIICFENIIPKKLKLDAAMIFCDIRVLRTIISIEKWIVFIHEKIESIPMVIVATHYDEIESYGPHLTYLKKIARRVGIDFILISNLNGRGIQIPFDILDHQCKKRNMLNSDK